MCFSVQMTIAQQKQIVRISEIEIYPEYLSEYKSILKTEAEASVRLEAGVVSIFSMFQKEDSTQIRILEIYADEDAYKSHIASPHFQHYKTTTLKMVKSLKLVDMSAIDLETMNKIFKKEMKTENKSEDILTFELSNKVTREKVSYRNRYGIDIAADLYLPKEMDINKKHPAIIVGAPYGGVKEQGAGIYAQSMAERGFVAIAFDESYNGESGGNPRRISSPEIFVEDFSATVDYIGTRPFVDRNKIGVIGICGSGGFSISAAQVDRRIKAVATVSMYDMSRVKSEGFKGSLTADARNKYLDQIGEQRWKEFEGGEVIMNELPRKIDDHTDPISREFFEYYRVPRGFHPNATTEFSMTSDFSFMNFPLMENIKTISPRPILFIIGEHAHSRYFSEDAYKIASEPKELYIVPNAGHVDLYDRTDIIPFDKLNGFFNEYLK